jgi:hypothetical protein
VDKVNEDEVHPFMEEVRQVELKQVVIVLEDQEENPKKKFGFQKLS